MGAELGSKNGVPARTYTFQMVKASTTSGKYSDIMINDCKKIGMKPVCDHPSYCKTDKNAVYIGQTHHLAHGGHRGTSAYFPSGWSTIASEWDGLCAYTANHGSPKALCNHAAGSHAWQTPAQSPKFMCAKFAGGGSSGATMTLVGKGYCKDARGAEYNQYRWNHGGIPSLDKCKAACAASNGCIAITWNSQFSQYGCNLHGERGTQPTPPANGWTATESKGNRAYGEPRSATGWNAAQCWKKTAAAGTGTTRIVTTYHAQGNMVITQNTGRLTGRVIDVVGSTTRNDRSSAPHWFELNEVQIMSNGQNIAKQATISYLQAPNHGSTSLLTDGLRWGQSAFVLWTPAARFAGLPVVRFTFPSSVDIDEIHYWTTNMESFGSNPSAVVSG